MSNWGWRSVSRFLGSIMKNGLLLVDHALVNEVARDLESGLRGTLAVAALEHVELAVLDGELHVLHVMVMILEDAADLDELRISLRGTALPSGRWAWSADAGDDVFALRVDKELTHELLLAGGGSRVKATPVPEFSLRLPNTMGMTLTAVPQE